MNEAMEIELAGHPLHYCFRYDETAEYFRPWTGKPVCDENPIQVDDQLFERGRKIFRENNSDSYVEYKCLIGLTAKELLNYDCCIFHAVSFVFLEKAWLITAPSGGGKTTQYKNWKKAYPEEITMISGDMPVLEQKKDGRIWVHPSPWNGKERIGNSTSCSLGGIVFLEHAKHNEIALSEASELLTQIIRQFVVLPDTEEQIKTLFRMVDSIFSRYPVWKMPNLGDMASTEMLRNMIITRVS